MKSKNTLSAICFVFVILTLVINARAQWTFQPKPVGFNGGNLDEMYFSDNNHGWLSGGGAINALYYNGSSWSLAPTGLQSQSTTMSISFLSASNGWFSCTDANSFKILTYPGWASVQTGYIMPGPISNNGGIGLREICYYSTTGAFGIGVELNTDTNYIYAYDGTNWNEDQIVTPDFKYLKCFTPTHAYAVSDSGTIFEYSGSAWTVHNAGANHKFLKVFFTDPNNGWGVGMNGLIMKYDGTNWTVQNSNTSENLWALFFRSNTLGWAAGANKTILKYDGTSWTQQSNGVNATSLFFADDTTGWAVFGDSIFMTTSGGVAPPPVTSDFSYAINGMVVSFTKLNPGCTSFLWDFDNGNTSSINPNPTVTYASPGTYSPCLQCTGYAVICDTIVLPCYGCSGSTLSTAGVSENKLNTDLVEVSPNPSSGDITIRMPSRPDESFDIMITNTFGQTIMHFKDQYTDAGGSIRLDLKRLNSGLYNVQVTKGKTLKNKKFMICR